MNLCLLNECSNECLECNWDKWYYGRCNGCGNCFNKDDWIHQRNRFEDEYDYDFNEIIMYYTNEGFNHEGNGACYECSMDEYNYRKTNEDEILKCN